MSDKHEILIFGVPAAPTAADVDTLGLGRVSAEAIGANLKVVMSELGEIVRTAREAVGDVEIAHVDVQLGIAIDGSVGLLGIGARGSLKGTLTVRLTH